MSKDNLNLSYDKKNKANFGRNGKIMSCFVSVFASYPTDILYFYGHDNLGKVTINIFPFFCFSEWIQDFSLEWNLTSCNNLQENDIQRILPTQHIADDVGLIT